LALLMALELSLVGAALGWRPRPALSALTAPPNDAKGRVTPITVLAGITNLR
jgi:hypothetical protein